MIFACYVAERRILSASFDLRILRIGAGQKESNGWLDIAFVHNVKKGLMRRSL